MNDFLYHRLTQAQINRYQENPHHALLIVGPKGSGKLSLAKIISAALLRIDKELLDSYPYLIVIHPEENKAISIDSVRNLQHFLALKIPGSNDQNISRIIIIEEAGLLTQEAQNALLKTLEEPPMGTVIILTAANTDALLTTIQSRVQALNVTPPSLQDLSDYFITRGYSKQDVEKALLISGGLPGLTSALLQDDENHPLYAATIKARELIQLNSYERLILVDGLGKDKQLTSDLVYILEQMSRTALLRTEQASKASMRWQNILKAAYDAEMQLKKNTSSKLVLTKLMLSL